MDRPLPEVSEDWLHTTTAIREQSLRLFDASMNGRGEFVINLNRIPWLTDFVVSIILSKYPNQDIPFHSRWRHFQCPGIDGIRRIHSALSGKTKFERLIAKLDLAIISVLLDAGAGSKWKYCDSKTGITVKASEGLAIASCQLFLEGFFSQNSRVPLKVNSERLQAITEEDLAIGFQVNDQNPMVGLSGRTKIINELGARVAAIEDFKNSLSPAGLIIGELLDFNRPIEAAEILKIILRAFGPVWPEGRVLNGVHIGDSWRHHLLADKGVKSIIPFHKLSQWMTYSLIEPLEEYGVKVCNAGSLTGLAEYRNGGLFIDSGILELKNPSLRHKSHRLADPIVVEWESPDDLPFGYPSGRNSK